MLKITKKKSLLGVTLTALAVALVGWCLAGATPVTATLGAVQHYPAFTTSGVLSPTCSAAGSVRSCDLWAKLGAINLPGAASPTIWGYSLTETGPAQLPGPTLVVNQGETVNVVVHNNLPAGAGATSLSLPGQNLVPDRTGAATGTSTTYTFTADKPGTSLYQAGMTANGPRQVALGLFGTLVVLPTSAGSAYGSPASAYDEEAVLVFSELDPALNANPTTFDMRKYAPKYWLINGKAFPDTGLVSVGAGHNVLLRYVNAGLYDHSIGTLGLHSQVLGSDGKALNNSYSIVAETLAAGQTMDLLTIVPATTPLGTKFALYNGALHLDNAGPSALNGGTVPFGGMLTFLQVDQSSAAPVGPAVTNISLVPTPTNGNVELAATFNSSGSTVEAAEYYIDSTATTATAMTGSFGSASATANALITSPAAGNHTVYVRGQDANNIWGAFSSATLYVDKTGPTTSGSLSPNPTNGLGAVTFSGTGNDTAAGNSNVTAAEYFVDVANPAAGSGTALTVASANPNASISGGIANIGSLAQGTHIVKIHSQDAFGNWGDFLSLSLVIDKVAPGVSGGAFTPAISNGVASATLSGTATDPAPSSNIVAAEWFEGNDPGAGKGSVMILASQNSPTTGLSALINTTNMLVGNHTIFFRAKDGAGNWSTVATATFKVDKTAPALSNLAVAPNPTNGQNSVTLSGTATDPVNGTAAASNIAAAEWFQGTDPGAGNGTPVNLVTPNQPSTNLAATINISAWTKVNHLLSVRAKDEAGNWSAANTVTLDVRPTTTDVIFANGFEVGANFPGWTGTTGAANLSATAGAALVGTARGLRVAGSNSFVTYTSPANENKYNARFYFNPNGNTTNLTGQVIFEARSSTATNNNSNVVFQVQYRLNGAQPQLQGSFTRSGGTTTTGWLNITNAAHAIEVAWTSGSSAAVKLYVDGSSLYSQNLNTNGLGVRSVRLGIISGNLTAGGAEYFDEFIATRNGTLVGQ